MSSRLIGVDTSRYATGNQPLDQRVFDALHAQNVELIWPGAWHGGEGYDAVGETLRRSRAANFLTGTYVAHTRRGKGAEDVVEAYKRIGEAEWKALRFVSLDMEWGNPPTDPGVANYADLLAGIDKVLTLGQRPCLYTANWWWKGHFGNPAIPAGLPLINAYYDNDPDFDFATYPYGGPNVNLVAEQYTNSTGVSWIDVDYNSFDRAWVLAGPGAVNGLALLLAAWKDDMADSIRGAAGLHGSGIEPVALALYGIRQQQKAQNWAAILRGGK